MNKSKLALAGAALAATAALTMLSVSPAQGDPGPTKEEASDSVVVDPTRSPDVGPGRAVSGAAAAALVTIQNRIATYVAYNGLKYTFGSYVDPGTGRIIVDTDAPDELVSGLTDLGAGRPGSPNPTVQVRRASTPDTWSRRDDIPAYYGGGGIAATGGICSSGYAVKLSTGAKFMMTAGHCYANGTTVRSESGASIYGAVFSRRLPTVTGHSSDMEAIGGVAYAGRVFTGGINSSTSIAVVAAGGAVVGYSNYCHSGRTTGEQCGHTAVSTTAQVCTQTGCKWPVIAFTGGVAPQGGDSGGAFYAKDASGAWIRGHVIASNSTTGYAEPWTVVAATLGVSIVTG